MAVEGAVAPGHDGRSVNPAAEDPEVRNRLGDEPHGEVVDLPQRRARPAGVHALPAPQGAVPPGRERRGGKGGCCLSAALERRAAGAAAAEGDELSQITEALGC